MKRKLTKEQKYNHDYYQAHKGELAFEERRSINAKKYRSKKRVKVKRNAKLRERWANDADYRKKIGEYQKAWRRRKKLAVKRLSSKKNLKINKGQ